MEATDRVYQLLEATPPDGATFAKSIKHILKVDLSLAFPVYYDDQLRSIFIIVINCKLNEY